MNIFIESGIYLVLLGLLTNGFLVLAAVFGVIDGSSTDLEFGLNVFSSLFLFGATLITTGGLKYEFTK